MLKAVLAVAVIRVELADLPRAVLDSLAELLAVIDGADKALLEDSVRDAADRVRAVLADPGL